MGIYFYLFISPVNILCRKDKITLIRRINRVINISEELEKHQCPPAKHKN